MSTTRHLVNRQRRLAAAAPRRTAVAERSAPVLADSALAHPDLADSAVADSDLADSDLDQSDHVEPDGAEPGEGPAPAGPGRSSRVLRRGAGLPLLLAVLVLLLGGFSAWAGTRAGDLDAAPARQNTALSDAARTSQVKGQISAAVNTLFSYDYADPATTDDAARKLVVGDAVQQYAKLLATVRQQAPAQKLVLTTTVTQSGVESLSGDRARLLLFADQRNTSTAASAQSSYGAAMLAVDAVYQGGAWKISAIDTFS